MATAASKPKIGLGKGTLGKGLPSVPPAAWLILLAAGAYLLYRRHAAASSAESSSSADGVPSTGTGRNAAAGSAGGASIGSGATDATTALLAQNITPAPQGIAHVDTQTGTVSTTTTPGGTLPGGTLTAAPAAAPLGFAPGAASYNSSPTPFSSQQIASGAAGRFVLD